MKVDNKIKFYSIMFLLLSSHSINAKEIKTLTFCYEPIEQFPYYMGNSSEIQSPPGVSVDLIKLVAKKLKFKAVFHRRPWKRCQYELEKGEVDGIFNGSYKESRLKIGAYPSKDGKINYEDRITTLSYNFYILKDTQLNWDGKKITGKPPKVIAPLGYSIVDNLKKLENIAVIEKGTTLQHIEMLYERKIDAVAAQKATAEKIISQNPKYKHIKMVSAPIKVKDYFLILSHQLLKKDKPLADKIWQSLGEFRKSHLDRLIQKY